MRLKLTLIQERSVESLPLNPNYYISAAIYRTLELSSPDFSALMHRYGYSTPDDRRKFKLFTFSNLDVPDRKIEHSRLISYSKAISLTLSSPMDDFLQHLVTGLFSDGSFTIEQTRFKKGEIQTLPEPEFKEKMSFTMLSPMVVSAMRPDRSKEFLKYDDKRLAPIVLNNLIGKYETLHRTPFTGDTSHFSIHFDEHYVEKRQGKIEKLITIREGKDGETKIKGILCPVHITGPVALIKMGYECGFGEKNAMGFGMVRG